MIGTVAASLLTLLVLPIIGIADTVGRWLPSHLVGAQVDLVREGAAGDYAGAVVVSLVATGALVWSAARGIATREL